MTREERIDWLCRLRSYVVVCRNNFTVEHISKFIEALSEEIEALQEKPCDDCISRQAVITCFEKWQPYMATRLYEFEMELRNLPSVQPEPFINKPCVSEQACREDTMQTLEKIKTIVAEWKADTWTDNLSYECMVKIAKLVEPKESEDKESVKG